MSEESKPQEGENEPQEGEKPREVTSSEFVGDPTTIPQEARQRVHEGLIEAIEHETKAHADSGMSPHALIADVFIRIIRRDPDDPTRFAVGRTLDDQRALVQLLEGLSPLQATCVLVVETHDGVKTPMAYPRPDVAVKTATGDVIIAGPKFLLTGGKKSGQQALKVNFGPGWGSSGDP